MLPQEQVKEGLSSIRPLHATHLYHGPWKSGASTKVTAEPSILSAATMAIALQTCLTGV